MANSEAVWYELYAGTAPNFPTIDEDEPTRDLKEGDRILHTLKLDKMWPAKFVRVDRTQELTPIQQRKRLTASATKAKKGAAVPAAVPEDEGELEPATEPHHASTAEVNDMTDDFKLAADNDLKVTYAVGKGYTIHDGDKVVNDKPFRAKKDVEHKLKSYTGGK